MMKSSIIHLRGMEFYGYHGVLGEEQRLGQKFLVDVDIFPLSQTKQAEKMDDIQYTINYAEVFVTVRECVENERYNLIEALAERIASQILSIYNCSKVRVEVHKPQAPIQGVFKDVSVEIVRDTIR